MDEIEAGATEAAATTDQATGQVEQSTTTVSGIEVQADSRVVVGVARSDVVEIRIVDTDIVLILADGRRIFIRDGAVQAVIDPNFVVAFADGAEEAGQSLIQSAGSSEIGRVALSGPMGGQEETVVVVQVPVPMPVAPPIPATPIDGAADASGAQSSGSGSSVRPWQTWAMIGTPLVGGLLGASGGSTTTVAATGGATTGGTTGSNITIVPTPVIFALTGDNNVTGLERNSGVTVSGTAQASATVQVSWGATPAKSTTADASGNWSVLFAPSEVPTDGSAVSLSATAIVGGVQSNPASRDVVVDTTGPAAPLINTISGDDLVGPSDRTGTLTISGTAEANSRITVNFGTVTRFANVDNLGTWSVSVPGSELPNPGTYNVTAVAVDPAGNVGTTGTRTVTVIPSVTVAGTVTAGPVEPGNDLVVDLYSGNGTTLATAVKVGDNGTFSVSGLSLNIGDIVVVRVRSANTTAGTPDYTDEATNSPKDLTATLMSAGIVNNATSAVMVNVNPLTTIMALEAGATITGSPTVTAPDFSNASVKIATAFGFPAATQLQTITPVPTNTTSYNPADGLLDGEKVGAILAAMSGMDSINSGDVQRSINELRNSVLTDGTLGSSGLQSLMSGAAIADNRASGNLQNVISSQVQAITPGVNRVAISAIASDDVLNLSEFGGSVVFSGTVSDGATSVTLSFGGTGMVAQITGNTWTYTPSTAELNQLRSDGAKTVKVDAVFEDGSTSTALRPIMVDITPPGSPGIGRVTGDDFISFTDLRAAAGVTVSGVGDPGTEVTVVWVAQVDPNLNPIIKRTIVAADRSWSVNYTETQIPSTVQRTNVTVTTSDSAGNTSSFTRPVEIQSISPAFTLRNGADADTDGVSTSRSLVFNVSGAGGSDVQLFNDSNTNNTMEESEKVGGLVRLNGDATEAISSTISFTNPADVIWANLRARFVSDTGEVKLTAGQRIEIDTVATVPTVSLAANMDSGSNSTDLVTNRANIVFNVTGEGGATVSLFNDADGDGQQGDTEATLGSSTPLSGSRNTASTGTITIGSDVAVEGTDWQNLRVKLVDSIGNVRYSAVTDPVVKIAVDRTAPTDAQTTLTLIGGQDAGATFGLGRTTDTTPTFNLSSEGGSVVRLFNDLDNDGVIDAGEQIGSDVTLSGGRGTTQSGSVTSSILADGLYNRVKLQVTDVVGNVQTKSFANFTIDTTGPVAPSFTALDANNSTGPFNRSSPVTISGTAEANTTVQVTWKNLVINNIVVDGNGNWSTTVAPANLPVSVGTIAITAIATDGLGNVGQTGSTNATLTMSSTELAALTVPQFETLTSSELTALTSSAMAGLTTAQLATLDATEIAALGTDISGLPAALAASISATQAAGLTTAQLGAMSAAQVAQFSAAAIGALSGTQLLALNTAGLLDDVSHAFTQSQFQDMGYSNIDTTAEVNLFNDVVLRENSASPVNLTAVSTGVSAVMNAVTNGASTLTLENLQALNLGVGLPTQIQARTDNFSRIQAVIDKVGEDTSWFDSVSELRRVVAFSEFNVASPNSLNIGTVNLPNGTSSSVQLEQPVLVEGKLYFRSGLRLTAAQWLDVLGPNALSGNDFTFSTNNGTWTLRTPGRVGSIASTVPRDGDGDMNPNSLPTGNDWVSILHSFNGMPNGNSAGVGGTWGWNGNPHITSTQSGGLYLAHGGGTLSAGTTTFIAVELVL